MTSFSSSFSSTKEKNKVLFFPSRFNFEQLISIVSKVTKSIDLCAYILTNEHLIELFCKLSKSGKIAIRCFCDGGMILKYSPQVIPKLEELEKAGVEIGIYNDSSSNDAAVSPFKGYIHSEMHHKFMILDKTQVITGSFNWTWKAYRKNQENLVILQDVELVEKFDLKFQELWKFHRLEKNSEQEKKIFLKKTNNNNNNNNNSNVSMAEPQIFQLLKNNDSNNSNSNSNNKNKNNFVQHDEEKKVDLSKLNQDILELKKNENSNSSIIKKPLQINSHVVISKTEEKQKEQEEIGK